MTNGLRVNLQHLIHIPRKSRKQAARRRYPDAVVAVWKSASHSASKRRDQAHCLAHKLTAASTDAEFLRGHLGAFDAVCDLLERDIAGNVGRTVARLDVDAERREAAIVGRA